MRNTPLLQVTGAVAPLMRANVDTDAITPSRSNIGFHATDLSSILFGEWRFKEDGSEQPDFVLNQPARRHSVFLVALDNFGCGSSRETAAWALRDFGIRCVIAPSFGSIFQANCHRNGVAPVVLDRSTVEAIGTLAEADPAFQLTLDLPAQTLRGSNGFEADFTIAPGAKRMLVEGLDAIGVTLTRRAEIEAFRRDQQIRQPWVYATT